MTTVAEVVVRFLRARGVARVYGLVGGHVQPLWDEAARQGLNLVDVRHESAAVYMAHAESLLTGGVGVALLTAGPGLTNATTAIANAHVARASVLVIAGRTPRPQSGMGAMQDLPQAAVVQPLCRRIESISERHHVLPRLDASVRAALGADTSPGPAYVDLPTDLLREEVLAAELNEEWFGPWTPPVLCPAESDLVDASRLIRDARRLLVISGRGARNCGALVERFLEASGALYLDTAESRGIVSPSHAACVPAMRARAMSEADVVITLGRRLDFQLAYGSPVVFAADARFIRIGRTTDEVADNRRGAVELKADVGPTLHALCRLDLGDRADRAWQRELAAANAQRAIKLAEQIEHANDGSDGRMHPYRLISAINRVVDDESVLVADGGDILSFARVGLKTTKWYLDPGPLGCIGVGVPFANAAALAFPDHRVLALVGDGSFGFTAMELHTAVRHRTRAVYVIANNQAWNIDRHDQRRNYGRVVGVDLPGCRYDQVAKGLGAYAERIEDAAMLPAALGRAFDHMPALLDVVVSGEPTSPDFDNGLAYVYGRHALRRWDEAEAMRTASD